MRRLLPCLQAVQRATELGVQKVVLESDAMTVVVQAANSSEFDRSSGSVLWELKECLFSNFTSCAVGL